ncbi:PREDICTED: nucleolar protein 10 [Dufourea novaeangliae]|uniref:Nucleolar protein 10 n=1 Tax=Dufourea novaeangliae TaxID=178035 RepID=A0A154PRQ7_DUFNO|nr:PREDICTED: nucleolar protein 10 [Dufourea novaeangliae]KZC14596.1 Nucleolar protein 10 [Dufourea novaeangliae]
MQVSCPNNVKIYNLSAGKSLPEWLSERKRRSLLKKNVDIRRRIELIQDFDMPGVSTSIKVSKDGQYILTTGIYKPRVKCFDVKNLSLKFERCFDSEVVTFDTLSDDYSKLVFLHCDRTIEFHVAHGKYYRLRVPRFGRDLKYHYPSCDIFVVGDSNEIYRVNLERGQFLQPFMTDASSINKCEINPAHHLVVVGTQEGKIEAWDPRTRSKAATLDCAVYCVGQDNKVQAVPGITSLKFQGGLTLGVGTSTGQVLLYDIRSSKPFLTKDHMYRLPIKNVEFHRTMDLVYSMDSSIVKIWDKDSGKLYTSIEAQNDFNDMCVVPNTGMVLIANESTKMQTYYIPALGPAPYWCSFLDSLTEELEELNYETIYDDYKFLTEKELDELGLSHLKGTNLLRAYMHGYFIDIRLYKKARDVMKPFEFEEYKKKRIQQKIQETCGSRVQVHKVPSVNKELALKLMDDEVNVKKKKKNASNILTDDRFKALFSNPDFEVDKDSQEYSLLNPVISQLDKGRIKKMKQKLIQAEVQQTMEIESDKNQDNSSDESFIHDDSSSSEDEKPWVKEVKKQYRLIRKNERQNEENDASEVNNDQDVRSRTKLYEIRDDNVEFRDAKPISKRQNKATLGDRLKNQGIHDVRDSSSRGNREMTFAVEKKMSTGRRKLQVKRHEKEYKHLLRPAGNLYRKRR